MRRVEFTHVSPAGFGAGGLFGGGERYPLALAQAMSHTAPTRLVVFGDRARVTQVGDLEVRELPTRTVWKGGSVNPVSERLLPCLARTARVHAHQYNSVVTNACLLAGRLLGRPVYCTDHGGASYNYADRLGLERFLTAFLPVSEFSARLFPQLRSRQAPPVYGGVDPERFHPDDTRRRREVVFVGRLLPHKGIDVLLRGVDAPIRVYGRAYDPAYKAELERLAAGRDVAFHENASDAEIAAAYRRARVVVLPSVYEGADGGFNPWPELLGLTLLEAMACGTPVVATRVGGMPEIIDEGETGHLVEPGDPAELAERVGELLAGGRRWTRMSRAAADTVRERFTWRRAAQRCISAYGGSL